MIRETLLRSRPMGGRSADHPQPRAPCLTLPASSHSGPRAPIEGLIASQGACPASPDLAEASRTWMEENREPPNC
jgi:hypothetical protein